MQVLLRELKRLRKLKFLIMGNFFTLILDLLTFGLSLCSN